MTKPRANAHHRADASRRHGLIEPKGDLEARYIDFMLAEGMSPETMRQRIYLLRGLDVSPSRATAGDIVRMINARNLSAHSKAAYITVMKTVFADLVRIGLVASDPTLALKTPRAPRRAPRPITDDELRALEGLSATHPREYAWTILGAYAGLRAGEVCSLTGSALQDGQHGPVLRVRGKGGLDAVIPAHEKVLAVMQPLVGNRGTLWPMWPSSLDRAWKVAAETVGVRDRVFHQLRHTFATRLTRSGVDLLVIASLCRHASVATTQRYAAVAEDAPFRALGSI